MTKPKPIRWLVFEIPEDLELLAAIGRMSIAHGQLDMIQKRVVKTLAEITPAEADRALAFESSAAVRDLIKKIAIRRLGKASTATLRLRALLVQCKGATQRRNKWTHEVWARDLDEEGPGKLVSHESESPIPTSAEVNALFEEIVDLTTKLNAARKEGDGWLWVALQEAAK